MRGNGVKPPLNAGSLVLHGGVAHIPTHSIQKISKEN
jgi:hypothetical protein